MKKVTTFRKIIPFQIVSTFSHMNFAKEEGVFWAREMRGKETSTLKLPSVFSGRGRKTMKPSHVW